MLVKLLRYDIKNGLLKKWYIYLILSLAFSVFCFVIYRMFQIELSYHTYDYNSLSFGDYIFYIFAGMSKFIPNQETEFVFPILWTLVILSISYLSLYYPMRDLMGYGKIVLVFSKNRVYWWLSKCVWAVLNVLTIICVLLATVLIFALCTGSRLDMQISDIMPSMLMLDYVPLIEMPWSLTLQMLLIPFGLSAICVFQMFISFVAKPIIAFALVAVTVISSVLYQSPFLFGNYLMIIRSDGCLQQSPINTNTGLIISTAIIICSLVVGCIFFKNMDVIGNDK